MLKIFGKVSLSALPSVLVWVLHLGVFVFYFVVTGVLSGCWERLGEQKQF